MNDYLMKEVYPKFEAWVKEQTEEIKACKSHGQYFLAHHVDPSKVTNRGEVYDFSEAIKTNAEFEAASSTSDAAMSLHTINKIALADSINWAVQHDGFDCVKYDNFDSWGLDVRAHMDQAS